MTRAKFKCVEEGRNEYSKFYKFSPVIGDNEENKAFFKATPGGKIELNVVNENVNFEVNKSYFIDFTEVE